MNKQLQIVTRNQALKLKELGFDWHCTYFYGKDEHVCSGLSPENYNNYISPYLINSISAPSTAIILKWLREEKEISLEINYYNLFPKKKIKRWSCHIIQMTKKRPCPADGMFIGFKTYEDAESKGIDSILDELLKNKK